MARQPRTAARGAETLGEELRRTISRFVRAIRSDTGTPRTARSEALALLERQGPMNIADLARQRTVKHQTMRLIVNQLESDGLIARTTDPQDRRSWIFSITAAGRDDLVRERNTRTLLIDRLLHANVSDEERALLSQAIAILDRLSAATRD